MTNKLDASVKNDKWVMTLINKRAVVTVVKRAISDDCIDEDEYLQLIVTISTGFSSFGHFQLSPSGWTCRRRTGRALRLYMDACMGGW